jgi:hypothetical protein
VLLEKEYSIIQNPFSFFYRVGPANPLHHPLPLTRVRLGPPANHPCVSSPNQPCACARRTSRRSAKAADQVPLSVCHWYAHLLRSQCLSSPPPLAAMPTGPASPSDSSIQSRPTDPCPPVYHVPARALVAAAASTSHAHANGHSDRTASSRPPSIASIVPPI